MIRPQITRLPIPETSTGPQEPLDEVLSYLFWLSENRKKEKGWIRRIKELSSRDPELQDFIQKYLEKKNPDLLSEFFSLLGEWTGVPPAETATPARKRRREEPPKAPPEGREASQPPIETEAEEAPPSRPESYPFRKGTSTFPLQPGSLLFKFKRTTGEKDKIKEAKKCLLENTLGLSKERQEGELEKLFCLEDLLNEAAEQKDKPLFLERKRDLLLRCSKLTTDAKALLQRKRREAERKRRAPPPPPEELSEEPSEASSPLQEETPPSDQGGSEVDSSSIAEKEEDEEEASEAEND